MKPVLSHTAGTRSFPFYHLVDKSESYLRTRGVKDADDKNKDQKKIDGRKPLKIEKYKEPDLQGDGR